MRSLSSGCLRRIIKVSVLLVRVHVCSYTHTSNANNAHAYELTRASANLYDCALRAKPRALHAVMTCLDAAFCNCDNLKQRMFFRARIYHCARLKPDIFQTPRTSSELLCSFCKLPARATPFTTLCECHHIYCLAGAPVPLPGNGLPKSPAFNFRVSDGGGGSMP